MEIVQALILYSGVDVNLTNMVGMTALSYAIKRNQISIVNLLLTAGADLDKV